MSRSGKIVGDINRVINIEKNNLIKIKKLIRKENPTIKNRHYLKLLTKASHIQQRITFLRIQKQLYKRNIHKKLIIEIGSRVKLMSTKVGDIFFVDAKNCLELLGKSIGDAVIVNNAQFLIAGVY